VKGALAICFAGGSGNRLDSNTEERWFSLGLRVLSPPFIP